MKTTSKLAAISAVLIVAGGCGSGGSDDSPNLGGPGPVSGISGNGIAVGPISTFGSVVVNGVRYSTVNAAVTVDGVASIESALDVGDIVIVQGTINTDGTSGSASTVVSDDNVTGPVESVDRTLNLLVVLGQTVRVVPETIFDDNISPASLTGIDTGDIIEVSGLSLADGSIEASRIEGKPAGTQFEVHGIVAALDTVNFRFSINNLVVDYSAAMLKDFASGQISAGDFVEAKGTGLGANGELIASIVEREVLGITGAAGTHVEVEGFITRFVSATDFDVSGIRVTTTSGTQFIGGVAADLGLNIKVEVEGALNAAGELVAAEVDIRRSKAVRATATVDSVNASAGSLVILGIPFDTDALTRFDDGSSADLRPLTINDLRTGDYLEIRGAEFPAGSGRVLATILKREDPDPRTELQGFVASVTQPSVVILGVTINTGGGTVFRDENDVVMSAGEFFAQVGVNSLIKATGTESSATTIDASEVEFELEF